MERTTIQLRLARAALFTALCVTLSATTHVLLSRAPLPLGTLALAAAGVGSAAFLLARRERGFWQIAGLLVPLELVVDFLFTRGQDSCYGASGGPLAGAFRSMTDLVLCPGGSGVATAVELPTGPVSPWILLAAHVAVGLLAAWWLRRGEAASFRVLRSLAAYATAPLRLMLGPVPAPALRSPIHRDGEEPPAPAGVASVRHSVVRRGPPCPLPAC